MASNTNIFQRIPFIRLTMLFMAGIICAGIVRLPQIYHLLIVILFSFCLIYFNRNSSYFSVKISSYLFAALIFTLGFWLANTESRKQIEVLQEGMYYGVILEKPLEKKGSYQTTIQLKNPKTGIDETIVAYFKKEPETQLLSPGNKILFSGRPTPISNRGNPYEFDYRSYMQSQGINYSLYLKKENYNLLPKTLSNIRVLAEKSRNLMLNQFKKYGIKGEEYTVVAALTLGYRKEIASDVRDYFASTGAMHVLSVSGLHVGIIYMILAFLMAPFKRRKYGRVIYTLIIASLIWIYSVISGLSPSVQRAAVMFTFLLVGDSINRSSNILNSLAASAFFLMALNPSIIYDIGWQLSYLAVAGIVVFQPIFFEMIELENKLLINLWSLLTVSFAAQLVTFPLGLLYFSQFPNYFWLSSYIVIPLSTLIMGGAFLLLILCPFPVIAGIFGFVTNMLTHIMLESLKWIDSLPYALAENIIINKLQAAFLLLIIGLLYLFIKSKSATQLKWMLILFIGVEIISISRNYTLLNQRKMIVYNSENAIIQFIQGRQNYILTDSPPDDIKEIERVTENVNSRLHLSKPRLFFIDPRLIVSEKEIAIKNGLILFSGKTIQITNAEKAHFYPSDYLVIKSNLSNLSTMLPLETTKILTKKSYLNDDQKHFYYRIWEQGAFTVNL